MAALSLPRRFAVWRVEAPLFAVSLYGGLSNLQFICLYARPYTTQCLAEGTGFKHSAVVRTTFCLATSIPPYGLANVNPY